MSKIVFTGAYDGAPRKCTTVIAPDKDGISSIDGREYAFDGKSAVILPPNAVCGSESGLYDCTAAAVESAFYPVKKPCVIGGAAGETVRFAAAKAAAFTGGGLNCGRVTAALAELILSCLALAAENELSPVAKRLTEEIDAHISDGFYSLADGIGKIPLNYDYVRKLFRKETGLTPHGYLLKRRMELAAEIIASRATNKYSAYSVSQIAEACGFSEPLYFSRTFKKYFGVSPTEYAKNL